MHAHLPHVCLAIRLVPACLPYGYRYTDRKRTNKWLGLTWNFWGSLGSSGMVIAASAVLTPESKATKETKKTSKASDGNLPPRPEPRAENQQGKAFDCIH